MEQNVTKASKRAMWSVYVFVAREVQKGRILTRRSRLTQIRSPRYIPGPVETEIFKFLYLNVTKMYKKGKILYVQIGVGKKKEIHKHDMKYVVSIQAREHDRSGRVQ